MDAELLQLIAIAASAIMALSTVAALIWGVWTYRRNGQAQTQLLALAALQRHLDLAVAHPDLASGGDERPIDARYAWFAVQSLVTAQTLWTLVGRHADWQRAIGAIARQHRPYLRSGAFVCGDYNPAFVDYLRSRVADLRCAEPGEDGTPTTEDGRPLSP